jgi:hypothetical protein
MDGRCKDCRFWERVCETTEHPFDEDTAQRHNYGACHKIVDGTTLAYKQDQSSVLTEDMAFTLDGSGFRSAIFTGQEFGCVQFEAKVGQD